MPYIQDALEVIDIELNAVQKLKSSIGAEFEKACELMEACLGRVIVIGMGKSGHIGSKIAATLASTGTPAFFVHPAEAGHGDFGMITKNDVIFAISNSGSTSEVIQLIPLIKRIGIPLISVTGKPTSILAIQSDVNLDISIEKEACPHGIAPTASTTTTLVLGDALAIAILKSKGFTEEDFAFSHPSGALGKRLLLRVKDIMKIGNNLPIVSSDSTIEETILEISNKGLGMTIVSDDKLKVLGIFTDGDLRRIFQLDQYRKGIKVSEIMTSSPLLIHEEELAAKALGIMDDKKITSLVVRNSQDHLVGVVHMHDLIQQGIA